MRLAIVATHPVQYNSPWFRMLAETSGIDLRVFYTWHSGETRVVDPGFGKQITWDIPLTDGFPWELAGPSHSVERRTFQNLDSPKLVGRLRWFSPDAVLVFSWNYRSHLRVMRTYHGRVPVLFRGDSTLLDRRGWVRDRMRKAVLRRVYRRVDYALSVGTNNSDYFLHHGLKPSQIVLVPHAIDNRRFGGIGECFDQQATALREQLGFTDEQTVLLFAGKYERKKAPDRLIQAYRCAVQRRPELRLLMVGSGPLENQLRRQAVGLSGVTFLPFQNQSRIPVVYRVGDITILPSSFNETWGLCLNESMASGRAVLASDCVGAATDVVRDDITGYRCRPDEQSLATALTDLPDRTKLLELGAKSQDFIQQWSFETICKRIVELLRSVASTQGA